jgi:hypothetical protein
MTQPPENPAHETLADKPVVAGAQAAADATHNAFRNEDLGPDRIEDRLREELDRAGVGDVDQDWVRESAASIAAGEPVVIEPDETSPDS